MVIYCYHQHSPSAATFPAGKVAALHEGGMEHEAGVGLRGLGSAFLLRLPRFLEVSGTRFRVVAGNTYVLAELRKDTISLNLG